MRRWLMPLIGVALILCGVAGMTGTVVFDYLASGSLSRQGSVDSSGSGGPAGGVDAMFIEAMIPHHDGAIAMSDLAVDRAEHPELRELARDISRKQSAENEQMREWYQDWFDTRVPEGRSSRIDRMMGFMMGGDVDLEALGQAEPFDKAFIEEMVPHHGVAIMMARMLRAQTNEPEMREFAEEIIDGQSAEIDQMLTWYDEWYGQ